ncbi:hypothetical protein TNCV_1446421 [Trichonephila clavipes]|nr:hypothetical protein TNCV_1446421 [Trichonephila clavipes]
MKINRLRFFIESALNEKYRLVQRFFVSREGLVLAQSQIVEIYGEEAMSRQQAAKWCHYFKSGRQEDVGNSNMEGSDGTSSSTAEINTA